MQTSHYSVNRLSRNSYDCDYLMQELLSHPLELCVFCRRPCRRSCLRPTWTQDIEWRQCGSTAARDVLADTHRSACYHRYYCYSNNPISFIHWESQQSLTSYRSWYITGHFGDNSFHTFNCIGTRNFRRSIPWKHFTQQLPPPRREHPPEVTPVECSLKAII